MRRRPITILTIALVAVVVLTAAGCGSKKKSSTTTTTTTVTTSAAATTAATTTTTAATTSTAASTTTSTNSLGSLASVENCKSLSDLGAAFASPLQGAGGDVQKEVQIMQDFASKTPSDIRPDFETLAAAFAKAADALKGVDVTSGKQPNPATLAKLAALGQQFNSPALKKAEADIQTWAAKNCHG